MSTTILTPAEYVATLSTDARADIGAGQWDEVATDALYAATGATTRDDMADAREAAEIFAASPVKGELCMIGASAMCDMVTGWHRNGVRVQPEGRNASQYFDSMDRYLGPDDDGIAPTFRDLTAEESAEYLAQEAA